MSEAKEFQLEFSNRVIEHLGIKLYQNKPTNVVAEFVSNAWDADAEAVDINIISVPDEAPDIIIIDNGRGMTREELTDHFLVIGRNRRDSPSQKSPNGRTLMGRKGIGKLAGFGIAKTVDVITVENPKKRIVPVENRNVYWLRFHLSQLTSPETESEKKYRPEIIADGITVEAFRELKQTKDNNELLKVYLDHLAGGTGGTCIWLSQTTLKRSIDPVALLKSLGRRFTVTMLRPDFIVKVNSKRIEPADALPALYPFGFGSINQPKSETILVRGIEREIKYWIKFVSIKDEDWSIEHAGIGIYAHGKIAQDRPFFFNIRGKEILSRYLYGVVEADWLDELEEDVVSTDRRSINWDAEDVSALQSWGLRNIPQWLNEFKDWRQAQERTEIVRKFRESRSRQWRFTSTEENALADLLSEVLPSFGNDESAKEKATDSFAEAWIHEPTRKLTQSLWDGVFRNSELPTIDFLNLLEEIKKSMVPEAMGLAVTMSQKISAITALMNLINYDKRETDLQKLIENFPWLLGPEWELLTANQQIRTLVLSKHIPNTDGGEWKLNDSSAGLKPDFVFLSDGSEQEIVVIELKGPEGDKTLQPCEFDQLQSYLKIIERAKPQTAPKLKGILIGHNRGGFDNTDTRITIQTWDEVLQRARLTHLTYLNALLQASSPDQNDARLKQIAIFGGKETIELIERMKNISPLHATVIPALELGKEEK